MAAFSLLLLAFAVSLDSFSAGFTYGLRKIRIPVKSILVIASCSAATLLGATAFARIIETFISPEMAEKIGGVVFIFLGAWILLQFLLNDKNNDEIARNKAIVNLEIKSLGLVIQILKKPVSADFDRSGVITGIEAFMLGLALSLDAFGAGIGAVLIGLNPFALALAVAVMSSSFVYLGMKAGTLLSQWRIVQKLSFIPGILLIFLGVWKI